MSIEYCDVNNGMVIQSLDIFRRILNAFYEVLSTITGLLDLFDINLGFTLPSGVYIPIIESSVLYDFRVTQKKYWAIQVDLFGTKYNLPLIKNFGEVSWDLWERTVRPINPGLDGTENWKYLNDATGTYDVGTSFSPQRKYHILTDGVKDMAPVTLALIIFYLLHKYGLFTEAKSFLSKVFGFVSKASQKLLMNDIHDTLDDVKTTVDGIDINTDDVETNQQLIDDKLDELQESVGLRLLVSK